MKKILLIACILSFGFAYAQQNDVFDVQNYLHKKNELNKKPAPDDLYIRSQNICFEGTNLPFSKKGLEILKTKTKMKILAELNSVYVYGCFGNPEISESRLKKYNERIMLLTRIKENVLFDLTKSKVCKLSDF